MDGILGNAQPETNPQEENTETTSGEEQKMQPDILESKRYANVGRPKKGESKGNSKEMRATIIIDPELMRKVKYISLVDGILIKDVIGEAVQAKIEAWEAENGKIKLPKVK